MKLISKLILSCIAVIYTVFWRIPLFVFSTFLLTVMVCLRYLISAMRSGWKTKLDRNAEYSFDSVNELYLTRYFGYLVLGNRDFTDKLISENKLKELEMKEQEARVEAMADAYLRT